MSMKRKALIFGAGQVGRMCLQLLAAEYIVSGFLDNQAEVVGQVSGIPVVRPENGKSIPHDCVCIAVTDTARADEMTQQLISLGYDCDFIFLNVLQKLDTRLATSRLLAEEINSRGVSGDVAEVGVFQGMFAAQLNAMFSERKLHLFDTFCGFSEEDARHDSRNSFSKAKPGDFSNTSIEAVLSALPNAKDAIIHDGHFPDTFVGCDQLRFAFVSLDTDLYNPTKAGLSLFWPRLSAGGVILLHDYNSRQFAGAGKAVREFCKANNIFVIPLSDLHGSAVLLKQGEPD